MSKQSAKLVLRLSFCVLIIAALFLVIFKQKISADSDFGELIKTGKITVNIDGKETKYELRQYKSNDQIKNYLFSNKTLTISSIELPGFENGVEPCSEDLLKSSDVICFAGDVGVHSRNIVLVRYEDSKMSLINFSGKESISQNITSDVPNFQFQQDDEGKIQGLSVDNRDYDKDPLKDSIRTIYRFENNSFLFDREENVSYN
jgi:hypothetical protein